MKRTYQITGSVLLLVAAFVIREALQLRYYTNLGPGPGFFSFWLGVVLAILSVLMIFQATVGKSSPLPDGFFSNRAGYLRMGAVLLSLTVATLLLERLGFLLTTLCIFIFLLRTLAGYRMITTVISAAVLSFGSYYVFETLLKVPLPKGLLGF